MNHLSDAQRNRLAALLGMLGSADDGERVNASLKVDNFLRSVGLTWRDVLALERDRDAHDDPLDDYDQDDIADKLNACFEHIDDLKTWDANFVRSVRRYEHLTPRQCKVVVRIFENL